MGLRFHVLYTPGLNLRAPEKASNLATKPALSYEDRLMI